MPFDGALLPLDESPLCAPGHHPASDLLIAASPSQRHGISRLPEFGGDKLGKQAVKGRPVGFFRIDIAQVRTGEGKLYRWMAIDGMSQDAFAQRHGRADRPVACLHRLAEPNHPWTNGQVDRTNRTLKGARVKCHHHDGHDQLREHPIACLDAYNFDRPLRTLRGLTPYEATRRARADDPGRVGYDPTHLTSGLDKASISGPADASIRAATHRSS